MADNFDEVESELSLTTSQSLPRLSLPHRAQTPR